MDLGIAGRRALVCASSRGLGRACAEALAAEGVDVTINGRDADRLAETAEALRRAYPAVTIEAVAGDITTAEGRAALLAACPQPDILVNNNAGPTPGAFLDATEEAWAEALEANMLAAAHAHPRGAAGDDRAPVRADREHHLGDGHDAAAATWASPPAPRAGLTAVCKGIARDVAKYDVTLNNLLPERFDTDRQRYMAERDMQRDGISMEEARERIAQTIAAGRMGRPEEFGATCAFVCSAHAGYMSGMNVHLDGGSYPGLI